MGRRGAKRRLEPPEKHPEFSASESSSGGDAESDIGHQLHERKVVSSLSTLLLKDWAWGRLYGTEVHRYCLAAYRDGMQDVQEISEIAAMGSWGEHEQNIHRDLTRKFLKDISLPPPAVFPVNCIEPSTLKLIQHNCHCLLPHEIFSSLFHSHRLEFQETFGVDRLPEFWAGASRFGMPNVISRLSQPRVPENVQTNSREGPGLPSVYQNFARSLQEAFQKFVRSLPG
eukprot:9037884-Pyramimonas_sp.AAC.1